MTISSGIKPFSHPLFWRVLLILLAIVLAGLSIGLCSVTLISATTLGIACGLTGVAAATFFHLKRGGGWSAIKALIFLFTAFLVASACASAFLGANILLAENDSTWQTQAVVTGKHSETRHRSRRVGRRYVQTGEEYKVYYMEVEFPGGLKKERSVDVNKYRYITPGDTVSYRLSQGFFNIPYISRKQKKQKP